jgi:hypothetical protein
MADDIPANNDNSTLGLQRIEDYSSLIGAEAVERILTKAGRLRSARIGHVSSTLYGGGVAEILSPLTLLMNTMGIATGWDVIQGTPEFFSSTKKIHNGLQGAHVELSSNEKAIYEEIIVENALRLHLEDHDAIIVHDPQPLPLIRHLRHNRVPWICRRIFTARLRTKAAYSAAIHLAGNQSLFDQESGTFGRANSDLSCLPPNSHGSSLGGADFAL